MNRDSSVAKTCLTLPLLAGIGVEAGPLLTGAAGALPVIFNAPSDSASKSSSQSTDPLGLDAAE